MGVCTFLSPATVSFKEKSADFRVLDFPGEGCRIDLFMFQLLMQPSHVSTATDKKYHLINDLACPIP
jgi:hypothetical protein